MVNCTFNGDLTVTSPGFLLKTSTFNGTSSFTRNGSSTNHQSDGGNIFNGAVTIDNAGSGGRIRMATTTGDYYYGNATFNSTGGWDVQICYAGNSYLYGNITINSNKVVFNTASGKVTFAGSNSQSLNGSYNFPFKKLAIDKSANHVTANTTLSVDDTLFFVNGNLITTSTNLLTMKAGSVASSASNSSFVSGPVKKVGSNAFEFPLGDGTNFRAIAISAPSNSTDAFLAEFHSNSPTSYASHDTSLMEVNNCDYWSLTQSVGSSNLYVTLSWNYNSCNIANPAYMRVTRWSGSIWQNLGNGTSSGTSYTGKVRTASNTASFGNFALAHTITPYTGLTLHDEIKKYALLAGDSISIQNGILAYGKIGAFNSISSAFQSIDSILPFNAGSVSSVLLKLDSTIAYCTGLVKDTINNDLTSQVLTEGIYFVDTDATLNGKLYFNGDSTSQFIIYIMGTLSIIDSSEIILAGVLGQNINWVLTDSLIVGSATSFRGTILSKDNIYFNDSSWNSNTVFSEKNIGFNNSNADNYSQLFSSINFLNSTPTVSVTSVQNCNMIVNGDFEQGTVPTFADGISTGKATGWSNIPATFQSPCTTITGSGSANTPDLFDIQSNLIVPQQGTRCQNTVCGYTPGSNYPGVPQNFATCNADVRIIGTNRYAGLFKDESLSATLNTPLQNRIYFLEFYIRSGDCLGTFTNLPDVCMGFYQAGTPTNFIPVTSVSPNMYSGGDELTDWIPVYACIDLTNENPATLALMDRFYLTINMNQTFNHARLLLDDFHLSDFGNAGTDAQITCGSCVTIGPDCSVIDDNNSLVAIDYLWSTNETTAQIEVCTPGTYTLTTTITYHDVFFDTDFQCISEDEVIVTGGGGSSLNITVSSSTNACSSSCNGSIDLTISGGQTPYSYLWSNAQTTQDLTNLCAGNYTVTVTDANGCTQQNSFNIQSFSALNISSTIVNSCEENCNGSIDIAISNGTSPYNYIWSNSQTSEDVNNLCQGTYTVLVSDANGCTVSDVNSIQEEHPEFAIVGDLINCRYENAVYSYSIINTFNSIYASSYVWSVSTGLTIISQDVAMGTALIGFPQYQGGSITVTYTNPDNNCSYTHTIYVMPCCIDGDHVLENGVLSDICAFDPSYCSNANGTLIINTGSDAIVFNGTTTVDQHTLVVNSNWGFGAGAAINTAGNSIEFRNVVMKAQCDVMWKGVQVTSGSEVELENTSIFDAQYGLDVLNGGSYYVHGGNLFDINYIGIRVSGSNLLSSNVVVRRITGAIFDCTNDLLSPYLGQTPVPCSRTFAGMHFNSVYPQLIVGDASFIADENIFRNLNIGIYANQSQLYVANCIFQNIRLAGNNTCYSGNSDYEPYIGGAIVALGKLESKPASLIRIRGFGNGSSDPNMFDDCRFGLKALNSVIDVQNSKMIDMTYGVYTSANLAFEDNLILNNRIESTSHAVRILNLGYRATMKVYSNHLTVNLPSGSAASARSGIYASQPTPITPPISPFDNFLYIRYNEIHIENAQNGIRIDHVSWSDIIDNDIYLTTDGNGEKFGIRINGLNYHASTGNKIYGSYSQSTPQLYGFQAASSINTLIQCNESHQNNEGFRFYNNCFPTDFWANEMIEGDVGLHLVTAAVLGPQTNFGNGWTWPFITWGAQIDASSIPSLSLFTVDGPTTAPLGPVTESTQGSWFVQGTCTNCENDCETVWDVEVPRRDYAAVKGDSLSLEWVEPIIWDARRNLYESLLMRPEIAEGDSILTDFLSDFEADGIGLLSEVGKLVNDGCDICTTVYAEFNDLRLVRDTMMQNLIRVY